MRSNTTLRVRTSSVQALAIALILGVHGAAAGFAVQGSHEPSTHLDSAGLLFLDPPTAGQRRIYFDAFLVQSNTGVNPNLGVLAGSVLVPGTQYAVAYLGLWADCNGDGTIGMLDQGLLEYRVNLLLDDATCPASTPAPGERVPHNDGTWVRELLWVGWADNAANPQGIVHGIIHDTEARVWGDVGRPGATAQVGCAGNPPPGTLRSVGGVLAWLDCSGQRGLVQTIDDGFTLAGQQQLSFGDASRPQCSSTPLNAEIPALYSSPICPSDRAGLIEPGSGRPFTTIWECSERVTIEDLEGRPLYSVPTLSPSTEPDTDGSLYDALSHTYGGADGQCSAGGGSRLDAPYRSILPEQPIFSTAVKRETTFTFEFHNDRSGSYLGRALDDPAMPANAGVIALNGASVPLLVGGQRMGPAWMSQTYGTEGTALVREDLQPVGGAYYTFYACVGPWIRAQYETPGIGAYGAEWCQDNDSGIHNNMDCDVTHWWNPAEGASAMPRSTWSQRPIGVALEQPYQFRDIDCYAQEPIDSVGLTLGPAMLAPDMCQPYGM